jgi:hypothetical protein
MFIWGLLAGVLLAAALIWLARSASKRLIGDFVPVPDNIYPYIVKGAEKLLSREGSKATYRIKGYNRKEKRATVLIYPEGVGHPVEYYVGEYGKVYGGMKVSVRSSEVVDVKTLLDEFHRCVDALSINEVLKAHLKTEYTVGDSDVRRCEHGNIFQFSVKVKQGSATNLYDVDLENKTVSLLAVTWSFLSGEVKSALGRT